MAATHSTAIWQWANRVILPVVKSQMVSNDIVCRECLPHKTSPDKVEQTLISIQKVHRKERMDPKSTIVYSFQWENLWNDEVTRVKNHPLRAYSIKKTAFPMHFQKHGMSSIVYFEN